MPQIDTPSAETPLSRLRSALADDQQILLEHEIYGRVDDLPQLRIFMREHVFAVWDFMSLLKRLQQELCSHSLPWVPPAHPRLARMVNEIVLGEESDTDGEGGFASHFELYLAAMSEVGADAAPIRQLQQRLREGEEPGAVLDQLEILPETRAFVQFNLELAMQGTAGEVAAAFCFGREDIIPDMFQRLLPALQRSGRHVEGFRYYLQRHIELDGNEHGPLALQLVAALTGDSAERWDLALAAARKAISLRIRLWDGIRRSIDRELRRS